MSNAIVKFNVVETDTLSKHFCRSGMFKDAREESQCFVKICAGHELGFGPMQSMTGIYVVEGKVTLSANLMAAALKSSGKYDYRVARLTVHACAIEFFEGERSLGMSEFTLEDAKRANLMKSMAWQKFPRNMLFARAMSNGIRWYCPDFGCGPMYTPEELEAEGIKHVEVESVKTPEPEGDTDDEYVMVEPATAEVTMDNPPPPEPDAAPSPPEEQPVPDEPAPRGYDTMKMSFGRYTKDRLVYEDAVTLANLMWYKEALIDGCVNEKNKEYWDKNAKRCDYELPVVEYEIRRRMGGEPTNGY